MGLWFKITCACHQAKMAICRQMPLVVLNALKVCSWGSSNSLNLNLYSDLVSNNFRHTSFNDIKHSWLHHVVRWLVWYLLCCGIPLHKHQIGYCFYCSSFIFLYCSHPTCWEEACPYHQVWSLYKLSAAVSNHNAGIFSWLQLVYT